MWWHKKSDPKKTSFKSVIKNLHTTFIKRRPLLIAGFEGWLLFTILKFTYVQRTFSKLTWKVRWKFENPKEGNVATSAMRSYKSFRISCCTATTNMTAGHPTNLCLISVIIHVTAKTSWGSCFIKRTTFF